MAAVDKMYVSGKKLREVIGWVREHGPAVFENGHKSDLMYHIKNYNRDIVEGREEIDDKREYTLWATPVCIDRWLAKNCLLEYIQDSLRHYNYSEETVAEMMAWEYPGPLCKPRSNMRLKVLQQPHFRGLKWYMRNKIPYWNISVYADTPDSHKWKNNLFYDAQLDTWIDNSVSEYMPYTDNEYKIGCFKVINLKSLLRLIRYWNIPSGYIVECDQIKYKIPSFKIRVK